MQLLRVPPYPVTVTLDVDNPLTSYEYTVIDMVDSSTTVKTAVSDANSKLLVEIPSDYDGDYIVKIEDVEHDITIVRPYSNPNDHGSTSSEIAAYAKNEELARAIIDAYPDVDGFYYKKKVIETVGLGADYIPLWADAKEILKVYENNVLIYDKDDVENSIDIFEITSDGSAVTLTYADAVNRDESARLLLPASPTDLTELDFSKRGFPKGWDYKIVVATGYKKLPSEITRAAELLIADIDCGKLDYYQRFISTYNTDQFRIQFDKEAFNGTGNLIVDKIISKYEKRIKFVGVL